MSDQSDKAAHEVLGYGATIRDVDKAIICRALKRVAPVTRQVIGVKRSIRVAAKEMLRMMSDRSGIPAALTESSSVLPPGS